jgi:integrase/recombinase XerD
MKPTNNPVPDGTAQSWESSLRLLSAAQQGQFPPVVAGTPLSSDGLNYILQQAVRRAADASCPSLLTKRVTPHLVRHTCAMHLLQAGIDMAVIALWLGHESIETTHIYVEADLAMKERALERIAPANSSVRRYRADDALLAFLASL